MVVGLKNGNNKLLIYRVNAGTEIAYRPYTNMLSYNNNT